MRLSEKIIWTCLLIIAVIFSLGGSLLIYQNHTHLRDTTIEQANDHHRTIAYALESNLFQDTTNEQTNFGRDQKALQKSAINYVQHLLKVNAQNQTQYTLWNTDGTLLFSTMHTTLSKRKMKQNTYQLLRLDKRYYLCVTSAIQAGSEMYTLSTANDVTHVYRERNAQLHSFLLIDILLLSAAFFIIRFFTRKLIHPIEQLNETSHHIAQGHYEERTRIQGNDEIGELSRSFDDMAQAIQEKMNDLKQSVEHKEIFMRNFSHEIKTPMTAILGFSDMLRSYEVDEETKRKAYDFIYHEAGRLEELSTHMMELLALRDHNAALKPVSIRTLHTMLAEYYAAINVHDIMFQIEDAVVFAHEALLFTLLKNLIDNALKAGSETAVSVCGRQIENSYVFHIIDEGIGMSVEDARKAVEPFYMADASRSHKQGGAGLGLSIAQRICELHGTTLHIQSQLHKGSDISFVLEVIAHEK